MRGMFSLPFRSGGTLSLRNFIHEEVGESSRIVIAGDRRTEETKYGCQ
jgi:hypothetical protein